MKTTHHFNDMTRQAISSRLNVVSFPKQACPQNEEIHSWAYPELPEGWDFNTSFVSTVFKNIIGPDATVRYIPLSPYGLGLSVTTKEPSLILSASLERTTSHATIHNMLGKVFFDTPRDYAASIAGLLNIFPAIGFTTIEIEAAGKNIAHLAHMGFRVVEEDREQLYVDLSRAIIRKTRSYAPEEMELKRNGAEALEKTLAEWDRDMELSQDAKAHKLLTDIYVRMQFNAGDEKQVEQLVKFKQRLSHDNASKSPKAPLQGGIAPVL